MANEDTDDSQMWKPPDAAKAGTVGQMFTLAKRLRSRAYWIYDDHYTSDLDGVKNAAKRDAFEGFAGELDELFGFDSNLTKDEMKR
jgi:hypothetical protein